ncbi:MAG: glycosyl hydrolase family 18 protein [Bacteroidota bacterium]
MPRLFITLAFTWLSLSGFSQSTLHSLVGYLHNWNDANAPYIQPDQIDSRYNIIEVAFATPTSPLDMNMVFVPDVITQSAFITKVQTLQAQGKKVLISIGGASTTVDLTTTPNKNAFINTMTSIINTYGFDGIDIDIENGASILINGGTIAAPAGVAQINLIDAIKQIMATYHTAHAKKLMLTMAPETAYVQGGQSGFGGIWGGYLPVIHALRDSLDILQVQLYNSGSMYGIDNNIYTQGTADFIIAMTEAVIHGFSTAGGYFTGLPANKVAVGLPACNLAAGGGYTDTNVVRSAMKYLLGTGNKPGSYTLSNAGGYPTLKGMMTWSINWDAVATCNGAYAYATNYQNIFGTTTSTEQTSDNPDKLLIYPNPAASILNIECPQYQNLNVSISNMIGEQVIQRVIKGSKEAVDISSLPSGLYVVKVLGEDWTGERKLIKE